MGWPEAVSTFERPNGSVLHRREYLRNSEESEYHPREGNDGQEDASLLAWACVCAIGPFVGCDSATDEPHDPEDEATRRLAVEEAETFV